jgi:hypothetical protein
MFSNEIGFNFINFHINEFFSIFVWRREVERNIRDLNNSLKILKISFLFELD